MAMLGPILNWLYASSYSIPSYNTTCLAGSGFIWRRHDPSKNVVQIMSTPQLVPFPTGFAARCDWVLGTRRTFWGKRKRRKINRNSLKKEYNLAWRGAKDPSTIFVRTDLMHRFYYKVMPCLTHAFVLVTGDLDLTIPRQIEPFYPKTLSTSVYRSILNDYRVIHHFAENLDEVIDTNKVSAIPVGINPIEFPGQEADYIVPKIPFNVELLSRPLVMLQVDRVRHKGGATWSDRTLVRKHCNSQWRRFCNQTHAKNGVPFFSLLSSHSFILCPHGYGLDPSPKAWEGLAFGAIPIIKHYAGDEPYQQLPVVFVDTWDMASITFTRLKSWRTRLAPHFENTALRSQVIGRLMAEFWWGKVKEVTLTRCKPRASQLLSLEWRDEPASKGCEQECMTYTNFAMVNMTV